MRYQRWLSRWVWATWWLGTALIVLSWFDVVSVRVGWIGFGASCAASLLSVVAKRYWRIPQADPRSEDHADDDSHRAARDER